MKILVKESQLEIIKKHLNEGAVENDRYNREVSVNVDTYKTTINGESIDWASAPKITLSYLIEMEHRSWGIKGISLYDIQGPSEIEMTITPQVDDAEDIEITLPLSWENVDIDFENGDGVITVGNEITIELSNDENGGIVVKSILVPVYSL